MAEKLLTNWFCVTLYPHLLETVGPPLFVLFKAVKAQLEKGPIDVISGEAKNSLSEEKLLRQSFESKVLLLHVHVVITGCLVFLWELETPVVYFTMECMVGWFSVVVHCCFVSLHGIMATFDCILCYFYQVISSAYTLVTHMYMWLIVHVQCMYVHVCTVYI